MYPVFLLQTFPLVYFLTKRPMRYGNNHLYILKQSEIHFYALNRFT
jgi:hypothetical protein